jgi:hypothetical protein
MLLEKNNAINSTYLSRALDIGHFNHRLPLLEHMFSMFIDQVLLDVQCQSKIPISSVEVKELLDYFQNKEPSYIGYYEDLRSILFGYQDVKTKVERLEQIREKWNIDRESYPFRRFYAARLYGHFVYETPLGWLALPSSDSEPNHGTPGIRNLGDMLLGVDFPNVTGIETGRTKEDLIVKIREIKMTNQALEKMSGFQFIPSLYKMNELKKRRRSFLWRIWKVLPLRLKIYLRESIYGR